MMAGGGRSSLSLIPQELIDEIVGYLSGRPADLSACALIGPPWLSPSRTYLFRHVHLHPADYKQSEETLRLLAGVLGQRNIVQSLTFSTVTRRPGAPYNALPVDVCRKFVASILQLMPRVKTITFDRSLLSQSPPDSGTPIASIAALKQLNIIPPTSYDFRAALANTLAFFQHTPTDQLEVRVPTLSEAYHDTNSLLNLGIAWKLGPQLVLPAEVVDALRRWEVGTVIVPYLWLLVGAKESLAYILDGNHRTTLCVGRLNSLVSVIVDDFWQEVGPKISHVVLELEYQLETFGQNGETSLIRCILPTLPNVFTIIGPRPWRNAVHCTSLRAVTLRAAPHSTLEIGYRNLFDALLYGPISVKRIYFELQVRRTRDMPAADQLRTWEDRMDWERLRKAVARLQHLEMLVFIVQSAEREVQENVEPFYVEIRSIVARRLAKLQDAGQISVGLCK